MSHHELGQTTEREAVNARSQTLLERTDGAFDFANVTVRGNNVHLDGSKFIPNALKLAVGMDVSHVEAAGLVELDGRVRLAEDGVATPVSHGAHGAKTYVPRYRVIEWNALHEKKINAESDVAMELEDGRWNRDSLECRYPWCSS